LAHACRFVSLVLPALLAVAGIIAAGGCDGRGRADPNAQRKVVVYCSVDPEQAAGILAAFEKQTRVKPVVRYDEEATKTTGLVQRLRAEADHPAADVLWSGECFQTIALADEGILAPYRGPAVRDWPAQFADPNGRWHAFGLRMRVIAWNTKRVKPAEVPNKIEDLLDARWKGRLVMADPRFGTTGGDVASWFAHYGHERAKDILRGLAANGVRQVQGNSTAVRAVAFGEADVCFTDTDDVYVAQRNGWPIAMAPLDQGGDGALAIPNTVALVKGAGNEAAAGELIEFLLSEHVERLLAAGESHNIPIRPGVAAEYAKYAVGKPLEIDYRKVAAHQPAALAAVKEILP
jgi:iron(III) transport system substrate-binding protein